MLKLTLLSLCFFASCTKYKTIQNAYYISDKYTIDTILLRRDMSNKYTDISDSLAAKLKAEGVYWLDFIGCPNPIPSLVGFQREKRYWMITKELQN